MTQVVPEARPTGPRHARKARRPRLTPRTWGAVVVTVLAAVLVPVTIMTTLDGAPDELAVVSPDEGQAPAITPTATTPPSTPPSTTETAPSPSPAPNAGPAGSAPQGWRLVAQEDFAGTSLNSDRWFPYTGATAGGVGQHLESNLSVSGGVLTITGRGNTSGGASWAPGQLYGRWEFRARVDRAAGYGAVVLLWPDAEDWPEGGEINIMEVPEADRAWNRFTVHYGPDDDTDHENISGDFSQWNTYAVEWTATSITGYLNGRQYFRTTDPQAIPKRPMHLAVQQDVGPFGEDWIPARDDTTPAAARMQIDWIRVYSR